MDTAAPQLQHRLGCQGEDSSALQRIGDGSHPQLSFGQGDVALFSSKVIPGNESSVMRIHNNLVKRGRYGAGVMNKDGNFANRREACAG